MTADGPASAGSPPARMRIAELSRRTGVSVHLIRMWERRYGLPAPSRSAGGYRLYSPEDEAMLRAVAAWRNSGVPPAQAVARVLAERREPVGTVGARLLIDRLHLHVGALDEAAAGQVVDETLAGLPFDRALDDVLIPYLGELGQRWADGRASVVHEHFASSLIRRRIGALTASWHSGDGPLAVLACPSGEEHELMLICFGVLLGRSGWRVRHLGANTPLAGMATICAQTPPDLIVLSSTRAEVFGESREHITRLRDQLGSQRLAIAGRGATPELAGCLRVRHLPGSPTQAAREVTAEPAACDQHRGRPRARRSDPKPD